MQIYDKEIMLMILLFFNSFFTFVYYNCSFYVLYNTGYLYGYCKGFLDIICLQNSLIKLLFSPAFCFYSGYCK